MRLDTTGFRFQGTLKTTDGRQFRGIVFTPRVQTNDTSVIYELRLGPKSLVSAGETIVYDGVKYLVAAGATEFQAFPLFRLMRMIEVTHELPWVRSTTGTDPVSGLPMAVADQSLGTALCSVISTDKFADEFKVRDSRFRLITNSQIQVNDRLGEYSVNFVEPKIGLIFAEVK